MRYRLLILSPLLAVLLTGCKTLSVQNMDLGGLMDAGKQFARSKHQATEQEELAIGRTAGEEIMAGRHLLNDPAEQQYVNRVGEWLALHTERPNLHWRFAVLDDREINAWAAPGGYVFITTGMLNLMDSESELAGVLGHEMGHVLKKHHLHAIQRMARLKGTVELGHVLWQAAHANDKETGNTDPNQKKTMQRLQQSVSKLYSRGLSRENEMEADRIGVVIAARSGYDPYGLVAVLQKIESVKADNSALTRFMRTHPNTADRIAKLEPLLEEPALSSIHGLALANRFHQYVKQP